MISNAEYNEHQDSNQLLQRLMHPRLLRVALKGILAKDSHGESSDVVFTVRVMPTAVRTSVVVPQATSHSHSMSDVVAISAHAEVPRRRQLPPLVCETALKRRGVEIQLGLVGDTWHSSVGSAPRCEDPSSSQQEKACHRSQQDVALLNSFSHIEHYRMDSTAYSFLAEGGGLYRSHFVHYLFTSVLHDDTSKRLAPVHIRRHNDTLLSIRIPPASAATSDIADDRTFVNRGAVAIPGRDDTYYSLPVALPFTSIEEILLAIPGIATQCKGCLLADTTFFVAGDWSGTWAVPSAAPVQSSSNVLSSPVIFPLSYSHCTTWHRSQDLGRTHGFVSRMLAKVSSHCFIVWDFHYFPPCIRT